MLCQFPKLIASRLHKTISAHLPMVIATKNEREYIFLGKKD